MLKGSKNSRTVHDGMAERLYSGRGKPPNLNL